MQNPTAVFDENGGHGSTAVTGQPSGTYDGRSSKGRTGGVGMIRKMSYGAIFQIFANFSRLLQLQMICYIVSLHKHSVSNMNEKSLKTNKFFQGEAKSNLKENIETLLP